MTGPDAMTAGRPREARLRAASAHLYPGIAPEIWVQASTLADIVWSHRRHQPAEVAGGRVLDPAHFEFRHEGAAESSPSLRRRATDRFRFHTD
jgi:hypothetical protein